MEEEIRNAKSPAKAKALGQTRRVKLREDWEQVFLLLPRRKQPQVLVACGRLTNPCRSRMMS